MKYNSKTKSILMASTLLCLLGFSGVSHAVRLSGSCPTGHTMDMSGMDYERQRNQGRCEAC